MTWLELREYQTQNGRKPFSEWVTGLKDKKTRARIYSRLERLSQGNFGDVKFIGEIFELRFFFGSGYRIYFGKVGEQLILLLAGGDKKTQAADISKARSYWDEFKRGDL